MLVGPLPLLGQQPGAADGDARLVGRRGEDLEILIAEGVRLAALDDQHADGPVVNA